MQKTIYLARHAKSSWTSGVLKDFNRPLSSRGQRDALRVGLELHQRGWLPQKIISSPAKRAELTCLAYCDALGLSQSQVEWNDDLYAAYTVTLLHCLTRLEETISSVMLVGHNPSMEDLLIQLSDEKSLNQYQQENGKLFTTANVAKITMEGNWSELLMLDTQLEQIIRPKSL